MRFFLPLVLAGLVACSPAATSSPTPTVAPATSSAPTVPPTVAPTQAPTATPTPIALPSFAYLAAAGNGVVWALVAGTRLFVSTDRGDTWSERTAPKDAITEIAAVDANEGWAFAAGSPATQCQQQIPHLWHTTDGAKTWQQLSTTGVADAQCKDHLAFRDAQHGYLAAHDPNGAPVVYRTVDGGKTWAASAKLPDPPGFTSGGGGFTLQVGAIADFANAQYVYATGNNAGQSRRYIFRSTDGGATWTFAGTPPATDIGVTFLTPTRWIAWLLPQPSAETTDGGSTWHPYQSDYQQAAPVSPQIVFGDANLGYATVRGSIQRTTDGGAHWSAIKTPGT